MVPTVGTKKRSLSQPLPKIICPSKFSVSNLVAIIEKTQDKISIVQQPQKILGLTEKKSHSENITQRVDFFF